MRVAWLVPVVLARAVHAEPASRARFEECKLEHRAGAKRAMKVLDVNARGRMLLALPQCMRLDDDTFDVSVPEPPPAIVHERVERLVTFAANIGGGIWGFTGELMPPSAYVATVTGELAYRVRDDVSFAAFGAYSWFATSFVTGRACGVICEQRAIYDMRAQIYDAGIAAEPMRTVGSSSVTGAIDTSTIYGAFVADVALVLPLRALAIRFSATVTTAFPLWQPTNGTPVSGRLAIGIQL
jgi:hypothetical protein